MSEEENKLSQETTKLNREEKPQVEQKTNWIKEIIQWFMMVIIILAAVWFLTHFIIVNARIPSGSMENTIMTGDRLIGTRFSYWFKGPQRGDIALFHWPVDPDTIYIKRVIGLPGETVEIKQGKIYINGSDKPLKEDYLKETWVEENDGFTFHVPEGCYLMLGDNRNNSQDSRYWAEVALEQGVAKNEKEAEKYTYVKKSAFIGKACFLGGAQFVLIKRMLFQFRFRFRNFFYLADKKTVDTGRPIDLFHVDAAAQQFRNGVNTVVGSFTDIVQQFCRIHCLSFSFFLIFFMYFSFLCRIR